MSQATGRRWTAREIDRGWRDRMAAWPIALELDGVCFCHGSPRADDESLTRATPDEALAAAVAGTAAGLVIGGTRISSSSAPFPMTG